MKKFIWVFLIPFFLSCEDNVIENLKYYYGLEQQFSQDVNYISQDSMNNINIEVISDSRCPTGAQCIWQGEAEVEISIGSSNSNHIILSTFDNQKDTIGNISIELIDVSPYPELDKNVSLSSKKVTLVIDKIN